MIVAGEEEDIVDGELLNWENLNLNIFEDYYTNEEEGTAMLNSGPSINNKRYNFRLNPLYISLDTSYTFNQNINKNTVCDIQKVV